MNGPKKIGCNLKELSESKMSLIAHTQKNAKVYQVSQFLTNYAKACLLPPHICFNEVSGKGIG